MSLYPTYRPSVCLRGASAGSIDITSGDFDISVSLAPTYLAGVSPAFVQVDGGGQAISAQSLYGTDGTDGILRTGDSIVMTLAANASYIKLEAFARFMDIPDLLDETDSVYFYFGWQLADTWRIERQVRATSQAQYANMGNNADLNDLAEAWPVRAILEFE